MAEEDQKKFKREFGQIKSGNPDHKSDKQLYTIKIRSEAIYKSKENETKGKGLKTLTSKQMIQRLPIAVAQVKAGNSSENLLNEIQQIIYSLYQSKEINKKYTTT